MKFFHLWMKLKMTRPFLMLGNLIVSCTINYSRDMFNAHYLYNTYILLKYECMHDYLSHKLLLWFYDNSNNDNYHNIAMNKQKMNF